MNCCRCGKEARSCNGMIPIDAKGTEGRRWSCTDCLSTNEKSTVDSETRELCEMFNPNFMGG